MATRRIGSLLALAVFAVVCRAQTVERPSRPSPRRGNLPADVRPSTSTANPAGLSESAIGPHTVSVVRLQVPGKARDAYNRAVLDYRKGNLQKSASHVERALEMWPAFPDALLLRGLLRKATSRPEQAEQDMLAAQKLDPGFALTYVALGDFYNLRGRYDDAQRMVQEGMQACAMDWMAYYELTRALLGQKQFAAVLQTLEQWDAIDSTSRPLSHLAKGYAFLGLRKYPAAAAELSRYLTEDPQGEDVAQARRLLEQIQNLPAGETTK